MSAASDGSQTTDALGRYVRSMPTPPPQQCRVLSVDEAAAQLGLTRPRTMGLVNSGGIEVASGEHDTLALRQGLNNKIPVRHV